MKNIFYINFNILAAIILTIYFLSSSVHAESTLNNTTFLSGNATLSPSSITSGNVYILFTASDSENGVKSITLPNGTTVYDTSVTYTATNNGIYNFIVTDSNNNNEVFPITVDNIDRTVIITHPISICYSLNPNNEIPFTCPDIKIINNSKIKVNVSVRWFKSINGGSIFLNDVQPNKYSNWNALSADQTKSDIALGVKIKESVTGSSTWYYIKNPRILYAESITTQIALGRLNPNGAIGNLSISALHGFAWDSLYTTVHNLTIVFDAC